MGCDIYYSGFLEKENIQVKVIRFFKTYHTERNLLYIKPIPDKMFWTKYDDEIIWSTNYKFTRFPVETIYTTFNFFGAIPLFDDEFDLQGQVVFDRNNGGKLVTLSKLPAEFNCTSFPPGNFIKDTAAVRIEKKGYERAIGGATAFCLMLRIIALRWWPELEVSDDYNNYPWISTFLAKTDLEETLLNEKLDFDACWELYKDEYDYWFPPSKHEPEPAKPILRVVPPDAMKIPIENLELSVRSETALKRLEIKTTGELIAYSPKELLKIKNCGVKSVREIQGVLKDIGLYLRPNHE